MNVIPQFKKIFFRKCKVKRVRRFKDVILEGSRGKELSTGRKENRKKGEIQTS